jgi:hypothetical protein
MRLVVLMWCTAAAALLSTVGSHAQSDPAKAIIGTWRIVEFSDWDSTGQCEQKYGPHPIGFFSYDVTGHVILFIQRTPLPKPFQAGPDSATAEELRDLFNSGIGYFGRYTVDAKRSIVVHHVEGGTLPNYIGTDQERPFVMKGDSLIIGIPGSWRRALVRVR